MPLIQFIPALSLLSTAISVPKSEHPRPDMRRAEWMSLNGQWEFGETDDSTDLSWLQKVSFPDKITVPFCRESTLSGLKRTGFVKNVWYRRKFKRPAWNAPKTLIHIGACDWKTTVWINGRRVGEHTGGNSPIDLDISGALWSGENTVVIHAFDDTKSGLQALGKQCTEENSFGCLYTRTTGIWQSVWLEGVGSTYVSGLKLRGNANGKFEVKPKFSNFSPAVTATYTITDNGKRIAFGSLNLTKPTSVQLKNVRKWELKNPKLYDVQVKLFDKGNLVDTLNSYVGFRSVQIDGQRILINGKPIFQRLILDQGFYPKGVWTSPSDTDLKRDIELSMNAGFNGARLHHKVFEPRFLYWADKLGYLVWGEYPNWGLDYRKPINSTVLTEWQEIVNRDFSHPSIIGWCPFNETPSEAGNLQNLVVKATRQLDPSRPVIDTSGYIHSALNPMVLDAHDYDQNPITFRKRWQDYFNSSSLPARYRQNTAQNIPFMVSEFGGIGWDTAGGWGYGEGPKTLDEFYKRFEGLCAALLENPNMFGYCYTQLTDVEQEKNGIYSYDRKPKFDLTKLRAAQSKIAAIETAVTSLKNQTEIKWRVLLGSGRDSNTSEWRKTETEPTQNWNLSNFDDSTWTKAKGAFADSGTATNGVRTVWRSKDIWLRQHFTWNGKSFQRAILAMHYDNQATIYLNGKLLWLAKPGTWNDLYEPIDVTKFTRHYLVKGKNLLAVHCHQDTGGQYIDLALLVR